VVLVDAMQMIVHAAQQHPVAKAPDLAQAVKRKSIHASRNPFNKVSKGELK
jgi:hypothetical protein